jgi:uncharacterized protein
MATLVLLLFLIAIMAFLYASVGHGGASGYLALMAIFSISPEVMKPTALLLNLFVSMISFVAYYQNGHFKKEVFIPLALASIPLSFVGGTMKIDSHAYKTILGLILILPILRLIMDKKEEIVDLAPSRWPHAIVLGSSIGFISGLIGIGGGIILSPALLLLRWTNLKQTAAISALFIFVNSAAGLLGQAKTGIHFQQEMWWYVCFAVVGGYVGAKYGANKFNNKILKYALALVLLIASYKLIFTTA